ncbi:MAG: hypothetical protein QOD58_1779 [Mycobacterium sp.]|nr:hypothetical protein [Mycobacterium sp.]MDT5173300.1 hypothetical protein [Mycobacterium sp.]
MRPIVNPTIPSNRYTPRVRARPNSPLKPVATAMMLNNAPTGAVKMAAVLIPSSTRHPAVTP